MPLLCETAVSRNSNSRLSCYFVANQAERNYDYYEITYASDLLKIMCLADGIITPLSTSLPHPSFIHRNIGMCVSKVAYELLLVASILLCCRRLFFELFLYFAYILISF